MNRALCLSIALMVTLGARLQAEPQEPPVKTPVARVAVEDFATRVFTLQYVEPEAAKKALSVVQICFEGSLIQVDPPRKTLVAIGPRAMISACESVLKQLDVSPKPRRSVELTFYILSASKRSIPGGECPEPIREFCEKTKGVFKGFKLLEMVVMRTRDGGGSDTSGKFVLDGGEKSGYVDYGLYFPEIRILEGSPTRIQIRNLTYRHSFVPSNGSHTGKTPCMTSDVDFVEGQLAAVSTFSQGISDESLCIVVSAKLMD